MKSNDYIQGVKDAIHAATQTALTHQTHAEGMSLSNAIDAMQTVISRNSVVLTLGERECLIDEFLAAMNDIGRLGLLKYVENSFQARLKRGIKDRPDSIRCSTNEIADHAQKHFDEYIGGKPHDYFVTKKHQLAAVAFNAMMEFYFMSSEVPDAE